MQQDHTILNVLDLPPRILLWPASEVFFVSAPLIVLALLGCLVYGAVLSLLAAYGLRIFKASVSEGSLSGFLYWKLPHSRKLYPVTPPSYIAEFIG